MEINTSPPPPSYWTQPSNSTGMPRHRRPSPPILSPPVLIILLTIITFLFLLFAIPPFLSFTSHIFRPIAVKRSWDLLNIFLVLFAILCGIFARRKDDESANNDVDSNVVPNLNGSGGGEPEPVNPQRWFGFSDEERSEKIYGDVCRTAEGGGLRRLRRSSSSYPDLRQESLWETRDDQRFQFRFFDDFEINKYRATAPYDPSREAGARRKEAGDGEAKEIPVDTFVVRPTPPPKSLSPFPSPSPSPSPATPPPPPPPPPVDRHKPTRTYQAVGERKEKAEKKHEDSNDVEIDQFPKVRSPPPTPPPPPPLPPPSPARIRPEQKYVKLERRKSKVKKEIAMALTSLYSQRKRKKKQKIDRDSATSSPPEQTRFPPPPPPPLPPPPSSVFHNLFKKGSKNKRIHTVPPPPPPPPLPKSSSPPTLSRSSKHKNRSTPPPAPPTPPPFSSSLRPSKHKNRSAPPPPPPPLGPPTPPPSQATERSRSGGRPPLSGRSVSYYEENVNSGSQSPLIPMPPPPPPPPFKLSEFKFVVRGDYVRIRSSQSSRCSSPELDDVDASSTKVEPEIVNVMDGGDGPVAGSVSCPSPDVNVKADTFIARLYDGWRLEKINSLREKGKT